MIGWSSWLRMALAASWKPPRSRRRCTCAPSLLLYPSLSWAERRAIGDAMLAIARRGGRNTGGDADGVTCSTGCASTASRDAAISSLLGRRAGERARRES